MFFLDIAFEDVAQHLGTSAFEKFQNHIDPQWIEEALEATGTTTGVHPIWTMPTRSSGDCSRMHVT